MNDEQRARMNKFIDNHPESIGSRNALIEGYMHSFLDRQPEIDKLKTELETERLKLAACGVAAMQNTKKTIKERIDKSNPYWSASYGDVCGAVDREVEFREKLDKVQGLIDALKYVARQNKTSKQMQAVILGECVTVCEHALAKFGLDSK